MNYNGKEMDAKDKNMDMKKSTVQQKSQKKYCKCPEATHTHHAH